jgi:CubicO group peptidase (beta-lactamase class C family)
VRKIDEGWHGATLEQLLQNRGGAPGKPPPEPWSELFRRRDAPHEARAWFVAQLLASPPAHAPGTTFEYSNQGYTIAGAMLEEVLEKPWEQLVRAEVFEPLGMTSAGFGPPGSKESLDQPRGHQGREPLAPGPRADNPPAVGPAGTVHASIGDWARFAAVHLRGERGDGSYLKPETFRKLHQPPDGQSYAMGWGCQERGWAGRRALAHSGSNTMWYCTVWIAPEKDHAFLVATNAAGESAEKACEAVLGELIPRAGLR